MQGYSYPPFQTWDDSAHEFQSQGGSVIACTLLSLACNNPQSHLWLPGRGIELGSLAPQVSTIPLRQPDPAPDDNSEAKMQPFFFLQGNILI